MKNNKFKFILMVFIIFPVCLLDNSPVSAKALEIAFSDDIPPFVMNKGTEGLEPEIVRAALEYKGYTFNVQQCSYKRLEIAVVRMGLDAAAGVRETNDGTYYSDNFIAFENYAITKKKSGIVLNSIQDLKGNNIVTWQNAYKDLGDEFAALFSPDVKQSYMKIYREIPVQKEQVRFFWRGDREVLIIDKSIFLWFTKELSGQMDVSDEPVYHKIFPVPTEFQMNFRSEKTRDDFNEGLRHIRETGAYDRIFDKYLK